MMPVYSYVIFCITLNYSEFTVSYRSWYFEHILHTLCYTFINGNDITCTAGQRSNNAAQLVDLRMREVETLGDWTLMYMCTIVQPSGLFATVVSCRKLMCTDQCRPEQPHPSCTTLLTKVYHHWSQVLLLMSMSFSLTGVKPLIRLVIPFFYQNLKQYYEICS